MIPTSRPGTRILLKLDNCNVNYVEYLQNIGSIFLEYLWKISNICKQVWRDITYLVSDIFAQYSNSLKSRPAFHFFLPRKLSKRALFQQLFDLVPSILWSYFSESQVFLTAFLSSCFFVFSINSKYLFCQIWFKSLRERSKGKPLGARATSSS